MSLSEDELKRFVAADLLIKEAEANIEYWKHLRRKAEDALLDQMGMEAQKQAFVEYDDATYKVYTRRTTGLRVTSPMVAEAELRARGLKDFIDTKIDTAKLGSYYKKVEAADLKTMPVIPGLEYVETYRLYCIQKR